MKKVFFVVLCILVSFNLSGCSKYKTISEAKCVTSYPNSAKVNNFDCVKFGTVSIRKNEFEMKEVPCEWIVLEKSEGKALLLRKNVGGESDINFSDEENKMILTTKRMEYSYTTWEDFFNKKRINIREEYKDEKWFALTFTELDKYFKPNLDGKYKSAVTDGSWNLNKIVSYNGDHNGKIGNDGIERYYISKDGTVEKGKGYFPAGVRNRQAMWVKYN